MGTRIIETGLVFYVPKGEQASALTAAVEAGGTVEVRKDALWIRDHGAVSSDGSPLIERARQALESTGRKSYRSYRLRFLAELHDEHPHPIAARIAKATLNGVALHSALGREVLAAEVALTSFDEQARRYILSLAPRGGSLGTHLVQAELTIHIEEPFEVPSDLPALCELLESGHQQLERWTRAVLEMGAG